MTIQEYQTLTGTTVPEADVARVKAIIRRAEAKLEGLLGYSLSKQKTWTERGKAQYSGSIPFPSLPISDDVLENLAEPSEQVGDYQLFRFSDLDTHLKINPAKEVYSAKLVLPINDDEFITIQELEDLTPFLNSAGLVTALSRNYTWFTWYWWGTLSRIAQSNLYLAVDAEYVNVCDINKYPDLAFLLADMVSYYADPAYSLMGIIKQESIDTHSYTRASTGTTVDSTTPESQGSAKLVIDRYAGPGAYRQKVR